MQLREQARRRPIWTVVAVAAAAGTVAMTGMAINGIDSSPNDLPSAITLNDREASALAAQPSVIVPDDGGPTQPLAGAEQSSFDSPLDSATSADSPAGAASVDSANSVMASTNSLNSTTSANSVNSANSLNSVNSVNSPDIVPTAIPTAPPPAAAPQVVAESYDSPDDSWVAPAQVPPPVYYSDDNSPDDSWSYASAQSIDSADSADYSVESADTP